MQSEQLNEVFAALAKAQGEMEAEERFVSPNTYYGVGR